MAWNAIEQLNKNAKKAAVRDNTPKAHFRTQDVSINKMYSNDKNFYSVEDIEPLVQKILLVGLIENLEVVRDPCDRGEYRIVAGERRWRALKMLVEKGYTEFEKATCQIQTPASEEEETLRLIIANDYRNKTIADLLEEEDRLKKTLQRMKENGQTIMGIDLNSGRLRDTVAYFLKLAPTKVAQIESINKHLIPEFSKELKEGRLTFTAAYMISGMNEETQAELLARYQENGLTYKEVKEIKQQQEEKAAAEQIEGQMELDTESQSAEVEEDDIEEPEDDAEDTEDEDEWEDAHPESITTLCYSCQRYSDCNVKTGTCQSCDQYINKAEAEKTEEERYSEEQDAIDRETAKKLREKADEEKMQQLPSQQGRKVHDVKLATVTRGLKIDPEWTREEAIKAVSEYSGLPEEEVEVLCESTTKWVQETGQKVAKSITEAFEKLKPAFEQMGKAITEAFRGLNWTGLLLQKELICNNRRKMKGMPMIRAKAIEKARRNERRKSKK